jgi:hypothetical protein
VNRIKQFNNSHDDEMWTCGLLALLFYQFFLVFILRLPIFVFDHPSPKNKTISTSSLYVLAMMIIVVVFARVFIINIK